MLFALYGRLRYMNNILKRMRDQLATIENEEAKELVAEYDAHEWFVSPVIALKPDYSETGNESAR